MKRILIILFAICTLNAVEAQTAKDLFSSNNVEVSWLGIDFSHIKLIGDFTQFKDAGEMSPAKIKSKYFPGWNKLVIYEPQKFDVKGMLRLDDVFYDIDMITDINAGAPVKGMESNNPPRYKQEDIMKFVNAYALNGKKGIGIAFIAESFNKGAEEAIFHFIAINMSTKEILIYEKVTGRPAGIGLKNYWAGAIYDAMEDIKKKKFKEWNAKYAD